MAIEDLRKLNEDDSAFEEAFKTSLQRAGYLFPETEEELEILKKRLSKLQVEFPKELNDPHQIIKRGKITHLSDFSYTSDSEIEENLAMAAREGNDISMDVLKQMEQDRKDAEEKANKKDADKL